MKGNPADQGISGAYGGRKTALEISRSNLRSTEVAENLSVPDALDQTLHLREMMRIGLKRKWTILSIFSVFTLFSVVMTYLATPLYRASTTLQIERFVPHVVEFKYSTPSENSDEFFDFFPTQYELLKSRAIAERTIEELGKDQPWKNIQSPDSGSTFGSIVQDLLNRVPKVPAAIEVDPEVRKNSAIVGAFMSSLNVEPVRKSRLVRLHFDSTDPFFAAKAVNTFAQAYININLERRFEASAYAKTFLEEKLLQTKAKLEDSERELVKFSRELEIINIDEKQSIFSQNLQEYNSAFAKAEQERIRAEVIHKQLQDIPDSVALVQENKNIQTLKQSKAKLEAEYQDNLKVYKPAFPKMQQLHAQIAEVDNQIKAEIEEVRKSARATYRGAKSQESLLKAKLNEAKQQLLDLQGRNIRYSILKREVDTNRQLYDGLLQRLKEAGIAGGAGINNISIVDKAEVPLSPYKPNLRNNAFAGLGIGLIVGVMVAWLLEYLDDSIKFADEVERETGVAVLGVVPKLTGVEPKKMRYLALGPYEDPSSAFAEAYRSVRTALQFSTASGAPRRMVVTSSSKDEGKSTTALALAINFAQMGKPVLIIDADLRNPVLHKLLKIDNSHGLSNYLSSEIGALEVTHKTEVPNLFIIPTGPLPPNPVELLSSIKLLTLLSQSEEHFAHVIVDAPPVLGIADAIVLCNQVDNSVFVIESGKTRKGHAKAAMKRLHQAGVNPLGVILTKIDAYHDLYGYQTYYYQYAKPALGAKRPVEG